MALNGISIERLTTVTRLAELRAEWQELETRCAVGLPFQTWNWNEVWWRHFPEDRLGVRDSLELFVFRTPDERLVGVAPMMASLRPAVGPLGFRTLGALGADPNITELRVPLCDPEHEGPIYAALLEHLRGRAADWNLITWSGLRRDGAPEELLAASPGVSFVREIPNYVLALPATWDELKSTRPRNIKESLRKCYNSLKRDGHSFELDVAAWPDEVKVALERFFELHAMRSRLGDTVHHVDVFGSPVARAFLAEICQRFALTDQTRIFQLRVGGAVVAVRIGFALGDTLYLYYSGYDPAWAPYSVMTTTVAETLKYAVEHGFRWANLSTGNDVSKTRWAPDEVVYREALQLSPSWRGRLGGALYRTVTSSKLRPALRAILGRTARAS